MTGTFEERLRGIAIEPTTNRAPCLGRTVREQAHIALEMGLTEESLVRLADEHPRYRHLCVAVGVARAEWPEAKATQTGGDHVT